MKARVQLTDGNASSYIPSIETPALQAAAGGRTGPRHSCSALVPLPVTAHCGLRSNDILAALRSPACPASIFVWLQHTGALPHAA